MTALRTRLRSESGQALVFLALVLPVLLGVAALVVDVGSWYQSQRKLQTAVDAAALAGVQELPLSQSDATAVAHQYAQLNYSGIAAPAVTFPDAATIDVVAEADTTGIFAPVLDAAFDVVTVHAEAQARISTPLEMKSIAPIAIKDTAACFISDSSCFGQTVTVNLNDSQISSSLDGWINLECHQSSPSCPTGGAGGGELKDWIESGYPDSLPSNQWYGVKHGGTNGVKNMLKDNVGDILLFPVWDKECDGVTDNADCDRGDESFHVIGWAAFVIHPSGVAFNGQSKELTGHFVTFIAHDLAGGGPNTDPNAQFGVQVITLTK